MVDQILHGSTTITPTLILDFESTSQSRNVVHVIPGRTHPDITFRPGNLRTGTLRMMFAAIDAQEDSKACEDVHRTGGVFTLTSTDLDSIQMSYVVDGTIRRFLNKELPDTWVVEVDYQEVIP